MYIPKIIKVIFTKGFFQTFFAILLLTFATYLLKDYLVLILGIFLFSFLFNNLGCFIKDKINTLCKKYENKQTIFLNNLFSFWFIITIIYILFVLLLVYAISDIVPMFLKELKEVLNTIPPISEEIDSIISWLKDFKDINLDLKWTIKTFLKNTDIETIINFSKQIKNIWGYIIQFLLAIFLSFIIIFDKKKTVSFFKKIKVWNFAFIYKTYKTIFKKIWKWFWLIFKAQAWIALINTIITIVWFYFIGLIYWWFPYILTMVIIVFVCSFVPILWMWLSAIPLIFVAYITWWFNAWLFTFFMVIFTTSFEVYVLNPRIVSSYLEFPISITFIILIISEQIFWLLWFLIWIPVIYIILDLIKEFDLYIDEVKIKYKNKC